MKPAESSGGVICPECGTPAGVPPKTLFRAAYSPWWPRCVTLFVAAAMIWGVVATCEAWASAEQNAGWVLQDPAEPRELLRLVHSGVLLDLIERSSATVDPNGFGGNPALTIRPVHAIADRRSMVSWQFGWPIPIAESYDWRTPRNGYQRPWSVRIGGVSIELSRAEFYRGTALISVHLSALCLIGAGLILLWRAVPRLARLAGRGAHRTNARCPIPRRVLIWRVLIVAAVLGIMALKSTQEFRIVRGASSGGWGWTPSTGATDTGVTADDFRSNANAEDSARREMLSQRLEAVLSLLDSSQLVMPGWELPAPSRITFKQHWSGWPSEAWFYAAHAHLANENKSPIRYGVSEWQVYYRGPLFWDRAQWFDASVSILTLVPLVLCLWLVWHSVRGLQWLIATRRHRHRLRRGRCPRCAYELPAGRVV